MIYQIEKSVSRGRIFFFSVNFSSHGQASRYTQWEENYGHRLNFNFMLFFVSKQHLSWYRVPNSYPSLSTPYVNHRQTLSDLSPQKCTKSPYFEVLSILFIKGNFS